MGECCSSTKVTSKNPEEKKAEEKNNKSIENKLKQKKVNNRLTKLLLLGAGASGKTTLFKQINYLYVDKKKDNIENLDMSDIKREIRLNLFESIFTLVIQRKLLNISLQNKVNDELMEKIVELGEFVREISEFSNELLEMLSNVLKDNSLLETLKRKEEFTIMDNAEYFINKSSDILSIDYKPTFEDRLRSRVVTTGVCMKNFSYEYNGINKEFEIYDVGGQRSERKKWLELFSNVGSVIFVLALSGYNQVLYEDAHTNRLDEALNLYASTVAVKSFENVPFIVFFNKNDIFEEKIKKGIKFNINGYDGDPLDKAQIKNWITLEINKRDRGTKSRHKAETYMHYTVATDTKYMENIFMDVLTIEYKKKLKETQLL